MAELATDIASSFESTEPGQSRLVVIIFFLMYFNILEFLILRTQFLPQSLDCQMLYFRIDIVLQSIDDVVILSRQIVQDMNYEIIILDIKFYLLQTCTDHFEFQHPMVWIIIDLYQS